MSTVRALAPGMGTNARLTQAETAAGRPRGFWVSEMLVQSAGGGLSRQLTRAGVAAGVAGARALWVQSLCSLLGLADMGTALAALGDGSCAPLVSAQAGERHNNPAC